METVIGKRRINKNAKHQRKAIVLDVKKLTKKKSLSRCLNNRSTGRKEQEEYQSYKDTRNLVKMEIRRIRDN